MKPFEGSTHRETNGAAGSRRRDGSPTSRRGARLSSWILIGIIAIVVVVSVVLSQYPFLPWPWEWRSPTGPYTSYPPLDVSFLVIADPQIAGTGTQEERDIRDRVDTVVGDINLLFPNSEGVRQRIVGDEPVPSGAILVGDLTQNGTTVGGCDGVSGRFEWYQQHLVHSLQTSVYQGFGNHDLFTYGEDVDAECARRELFEYLETTLDQLPPVVHHNEAGYAYNGTYSWDWGILHLVQAHAFGGSCNRPADNFDRLLDGCDIWLTMDARRAGFAEFDAPIALFQHYGWDGFSLETEEDGEGRWWTRAQRASLDEAFKDSQLIAVFHGHTHRGAGFSDPAGWDLPYFSTELGNNKIPIVSVVAAGDYSGYLLGHVTNTGLYLTSVRAEWKSEEQPIMVATASRPLGIGPFQEPSLRDFGARQQWAPQNLRTLADLDGDSRADIIAFGPDTTYVAYSTGLGMDGLIRFTDAVPAFGLDPGNAAATNSEAFGEAINWQFAHAPLVADVDCDRRSDVVVFGPSRTYVAFASGNRARPFDSPVPAIGSPSRGESSTFSDWLPGWSRSLADVNGDGRLDIVGFAPVGVHVAYGTCSRTYPFTEPIQFWDTMDGYHLFHSSWPQNNPRFVTDVNGDGFADIVGFGTSYVLVALSSGNQTAPFSRPRPAFGSSNTSFAEGWTEDDVRVLAHVNSDEYADIVGIGPATVQVALGLPPGSAGGASFADPVPAFGGGSHYFTGIAGWDVNRHIRLVSDVNSDGLADIVGFGQDGTYVSFATGRPEQLYREPVTWIQQYGWNAEGWEVELHPRMLADAGGDDHLEIVGFGDFGVYVSQLPWSVICVPWPLVIPVVACAGLFIWQLNRLRKSGRLERSLPAEKRPRMAL